MKFLPNNKLWFMAAQVWRYAGERRPYVLLDYALLFIAYTILSFQPMVLGQIIDAAQRGDADALNNVLIWSAVYASTILGFWLFNFPARVIEQHVAFFATHAFYRTFYRIVTEMPLRWHRDHHSGEVINRIGKAGSALSAFAQGQFIYFQMGVRFIVGIGALAFYLPWVAAASFISSAIIIVTINRFDRVIMPLVKKTNEGEHYFNAALHDYIGNIVSVLALRLQDNTSGEISRRFMKLKTSVWSSIITSESKWASVAFLLIGTQAAITGGYIAVRLAHHESLVIGTAVAIFQYLMVVNMIFFQAMQTLDALMRQHTDMHSIDGLLEDYGIYGAAVIPVPSRAWKKIAVQNLSFTHHEGEDALHHLRNVGLTIGTGQKIALVGASGAGKTTLLALLRGLYETQIVRLVIDDEVFTTLTPMSGFTTLVPQDCEIFDNTVKYNLTLGTEVPDDIVRQALSITTFEDVLSALPDGIETDIRERGVNLSGGQKQRLSLARGLIAARDSSLLLLDEPTSSVDLATESVIFDRLFAAFSDKTIVASVHRLHLLPRFDHIAVMQDGAIVEQGAFIDLLAARGAFYQIWQHHLTQSAMGEEKGQS
jgi:ATP-binding cassette subfamily B protein